MNCPVDGAVLEMSERQGVEIDYCPKCRGVWLDRGELDKVIERSESWSPPAEPREEERSRDRYEERPRERYDDGRYSAPHKKKRKSFLSELFED